MILPNQLTTLRIILTPIFLFLFLSEEPLLKQISLIVFLIAAISDWYDGWLARKFNYITSWGKFLDPLADKILTSTAFLGFVFVGVLEFWMVILIIVRDIFITLLRAYAEYKNVSFTTSRFAKWKTFIQMSFLYYLLLIYTAKTIDYVNDYYSFILVRLSNAIFIYYMMLFVTIITVISGVSYLYSNRYLIKRLFSLEN
ncbi:CDP-diacylglycerol--glycerol-3-phosphate 3-phosphatidyltransferase [Melioribacteraceae bacterium 4301-Me]|uniref:CDP-diacylglycerol--glycerol-3-phosphate 3-phosphatidyltransferase n=1 Tax=Pyranulibacter aquaticus TaxID=3163344 RepID=UPI00359580EF